MRKKILFLTITFTFIFTMIMGLFKILDHNKVNHYNVEYVKIFKPLFAYKEDTVKNSGKIKGKVLFKGNKIPSNKKKLITKDKEVCGEGYKIDEVFKINSKKEIQNVVLHLTNISKGKTFKKDEVILEQIKCEFQPRIVVIPVGAKLTIINKDIVTHEANGIFNYATLFQLAQHKEGMKDSIELKEPGIVSITCNIHGWMKAFGYVVDNPYYDISDEKGNFEISDIPPGTYKLKIWHEKLKSQEIDISIKPNENKTLIVELSE
ncbi:MAG: hypothetical protein KatS3mg129_0012 [Leptospiraceae bacterium]|nr:MAG: hypothetical protein KatS3mg129_0012 [Leptospiraceae bacterium]